MNQNCGVIVVTKTKQIATSKSKNPKIDDVTYYEVIDEIWQLHSHIFKITLFKCDWLKNKGGVKVNELGFILMDLYQIGHKSNPLILASKAKQVFYVTNPIDKKWSIVCFMPFRSIPNFENDVDVHSMKERIPFTNEIPRITRMHVMMTIK